MGTPTAPNFANLFMADIENKMLKSYEQSTGKKPLIWLRYLDDIFFIWRHGENELTSFIQYLQNYSYSMKMKTTLKYDVHYSTQSVNFLDTTIKLENDQLLSDVYAKPTDAHFYLRYDSCHPRHCKPGILKSQFLRLRRI